MMKDSKKTSENDSVEQKEKKKLGKDIDPQREGSKEPDKRKDN
ncbi:MAG TPA: 3-methyladenine DNA glycosylase [Bacillaceae bacterium]